MTIPIDWITNKQRRIPIMAIGMLSEIFLAGTIFVFYFPVPIVDIKLSKGVKEHPAAVLDDGMKGVSWLAYLPNAGIVLLITALSCFLFKYEKEALLLVLTMSFVLVSSFVKLIVHRSRSLKSLV